MRRDEVIAKLKEAEPALREFGVAGLYLFGSYARDEARPDSDVDVFVDPASDERFGFLQFMDAYETLRQSVGGSTVRRRPSDRRLAALGRRTMLRTGRTTRLPATPAYHPMLARS